MKRILEVDFSDDEGSGHRVFVQLEHDDPRDPADIARKHLDDNDLVDDIDDLPKPKIIDRTGDEVIGVASEFMP